MNRRRLRPATWALAVAATLTLTSVAGAATGAFSAVALIPGGSDEGGVGPGLDVDETVVAAGTSAVAGDWRITTYESERSEAQPAGLPCLRIALVAPLAGSPIASSGFCGELDDDFGAVSLPVVSSRAEAEVLIAGRAPDGASAVELSSPGQSPIRVRPEPTPGRGDVFVMTVPRGWREGELVALDGATPAVPKRIDARGFFDRLEALSRGRL